MRTDIHDHNALLARVQEQFGLEFQDLEFLPVGEEGHCYAATAGNSRCFVKLHDPVGAAFLLTPLHIAERLNQAGFLHAVAPLRTREGTLVSEFRGYPLTVYPFVSGAGVELAALSASAVDRLGRMLGRLHQITPSIDLSDAPHDAYETSSVDRLSGLLTVARNARQRGLTIERIAARALLRDEARLCDLAHNLTRLQTLLSDDRVAPVLTHGDLDPSNVLVDAGGRYHLVDWADAAIAPRERDLRFYGQSANFAGLMAAYAAETGYVDLNLTAFEFYACRWLLNGVVGFSSRILLPGESEAQLTHDWAVLSRFLPVPVLDLAPVERLRDTLGRRVR